MPKIPTTPDGKTLTSEQILQRDLMNILRKVSDGKPLTNAERDLIKSAGYEDEAAVANTSDIPKHTKSDKAFRLIVEREANCSERKAYAWIKKLRDRHWNKSQGWRVADALQEIEDRQARTTGGPDRDLKREKLALECDILRDRRDRDRGDYISKEDSRARMLEVVNACRRTIDNWIKTTAAEIGDPAFKKRLEDAQRKAYAATEAEFFN
jgi:hypothetical protein